MTMNFTGAAKRLEDMDIPRIAHRIGVGEDEIHAVMDVEARGSGFDARGRPATLFEPHKFWDQLGPSPERDFAARVGLAYPKWGTRPYPNDSYPVLAEAMKIDREKALNSASWGLGQIMGFNAGLAGYASAEDMVRAFMEDEEAHLDAMVTFIINARLDDELRRHDWAGFARGYNGESYAKHGYHTRLAAAFAKWQKIRDTPWTPGAEPKPAPETPPSAAPREAAAGKPPVPAPSQPETGKALPEPKIGGLRGILSRLGVKL